MVKKRAIGHHLSRQFVSGGVIALLLAVTSVSRAQQSSPAVETQNVAETPNPPNAEVASPAPPTVNECVATHREAQSLRQQYRLVESRGLLIECSNSACPGPVRRDCLRWVDEVGAQLPSVVFRVDSKGGDPVSNVKIYLDDELLSPSMPTRAVDVNPGPHRFRFVADGKPPIEQDIVLVEGEKYKSVVIEFEPEPKPLQPPDSSSNRVQPPSTITNSSTQPPPRQLRPVPVATYVLGGVGLLALGSFATFAAWHQSLMSELEQECAPNCEKEYVDKLRTRAMIADISLGVGVASLVTATAFYIWRPTVTIPAEVRVEVLPQGGVLGMIRVREF